MPLPKRVLSRIQGDLEEKESPQRQDPQLRRQKTYNIGGEPPTQISVFISIFFLKFTDVNKNLKTQFVSPKSIERRKEQRKKEKKEKKEKGEHRTDRTQSLLIRYQYAPSPPPPRSTSLGLLLFPVPLRQLLIIVASLRHPRSVFISGSATTSPFHLHQLPKSSNSPFYHSVFFSIFNFFFLLQLLQSSLTILTWIMFFEVWTHVSL